MEKTSYVPRLHRTSWKHLHGRGEDLPQADVESCWAETPPRTWRRQPQRSSHPAKIGNTSTDVEKTLKSPPVKAIDRKHLHGRGEDHFIGSDMFWTVETPPRTWRRPSEDDKVLYFVGKHLHGRGEDPSSICGTRARLETPPRTWRRRGHEANNNSITGNTSTDVEKTLHAKAIRKQKQKHLHGRGEDSMNA